MENGVRKREWVKTAAIILLAVLLVLTFFSKTIMNASLPEVATQQVSSGAINARIRGQGTVEASEVYNVTIKQTRKVSSVLVKTGQEINVGDTLFVLEAEDSEEVAKAEEALQEAQDAYDKALIDAGIEAAKNDRTIQKAQEAYNEALALLRQYSSMDASQVETARVEAGKRQKALERQIEEVTKTKTEAEKKKTEAEAGITELEAEVTKVGTLKDAVDALKRDEYLYKEYYDLLRKFAQHLRNEGTNAGQDVDQIASALAKDQNRYDAEVETYLINYPNDFEGLSGLKDHYKQVSLAYTTLVSDQAAINALNPNEMNYDITTWNTDKQEWVVDNAKVTDVYDKVFADLSSKKSVISQYENEIKGYENTITNLNYQVDDLKESIETLGKAEDQAKTVKQAKTELEDLLFTKSLGDSSGIGMEAQKRAIEKQKADLEKLRENADELEVKASVSGTIASISASAGKSIGGEEQPRATRNVTDRGFTVKIDVTNEQAKKVKVGDTAELVNFWGGDAVATLDQITNSQSSGNRTLVFTLTGDIQAGQNVTLSIGQKSANYDALIPLSGLREDSNGKFVYVLQSKNSPLGSRYIATRVTVQELARDDKSAAVSGISQGDFIITTSNKPVEAGKQVRLADNG